MRIQDIEKAVLKQLPSKGDHLIGKDECFLNRPGVKKDRYLDIGLVLICGLSVVYIPDAQKKVVKHYDIDNKGFNNNVAVFNKHLKRVSEIIKSYGAKDYKHFTEIFWMNHNPECAGEPFKSGIILSHILSSKKEFSKFIKDNPVFKHEDYLSFFIHNKAQLSKNYLALQKQYVDCLPAF